MTFMFQQGVEPAIILRLMASGIQASGYGESAFYRNMPFSPTSIGSSAVASCIFRP